MQMEMRRFLSTEDTVVLERQYSEGSVSLDECLCDSPGREHYGPAFLVGEIEQRRDMPTRDDATLAHFELPRIDHRERVFAFVYDRPAFFATCHPFAKIAGVSYRKLDHLARDGQCVSAIAWACFSSRARRLDSSARADENRASSR